MSLVEQIIRIKFPVESPRGQKYMVLSRFEALNVYIELGDVLGQPTKESNILEKEIYSLQARIRSLKLLINKA